MSQQTQPSAPAFLVLGRSDTAHQPMMRRDAQPILQGCPGAKRPFLLGSLIHVMQVSKRSKQRQTSDPFEVIAGFEPLIEQFETDQKQPAAQYPHHSSKGGQKNQLRQTAPDHHGSLGSRGEELSITGGILFK